MRIETHSISGSRHDEADPFQVALSRIAPRHGRAALIAARPFLSWALALESYRSLYQRAQLAPDSTFCARALRVLDVDVAAVASDVLNLPNAGPLIVVANHPHGMIDGLALVEVVYRRRGDVRVLTNHLLAPIPELSELCLFVDSFGGRNAAAQSRAGLRAALQWLRDDHALIVFPAGEVAHQGSAIRDQRSGSSDALAFADSPWHATVGRLALRSGAVVVPAFIEGSNSRWFYRIGRLHARLRTLLLARELLCQRGRRITIRVGSPVGAIHRVAAPGDGVVATAIMRRAVDDLAVGHRNPFEAEISSLRKEHRLIEHADFEVFCAPASSIPTIVREIGRLREVAFRAIGEGTGRTIDLDRFDEHYLHLFVWNRARGEVVGAYRLGRVDDILASHGIGGLYTSTLFRYDSRLLARLSPALELGRSFVRAEYQRSSNALLLLWKGIAAFVAQSRRYRVLFGPVTISSRYGELSQQLLRAFLAQNFYHRELGELVEALKPPTDRPLPAGDDATAAADLHEVDRLIARLEGDGKGIPVLLRQYLRLNAKVLGFNVDPAFGDALDALMLVDLADVDPAILNRYFGKDEARHIRAAVSPARALRRPAA